MYFMLMEKPNRLRKKLHFCSIMNNIKNIIFDFGTVLLNIDYMLTAKAFEELGLKDFHAQFAYKNQHQVFDDLEMGLISPSEFYNHLRKQTGLNLADEQLKQAWNAILMDFPQSRIDCLLGLKKKYRLFLLSNTNAIHVEAFTTSLNTIHNCDFLNTMFEKCYYSNEINLRKPSKEIYEYVMADKKLVLSETVFVDDLKENVDTAIEVGLQGIWLPKGEEINSLKFD
jgi:FMN phosphatase YigB (HAD superfamily)